MGYKTRPRAAVSDVRTWVAKTLGGREDAAAVAEEELSQEVAGANARGV